MGGNSPPHFNPSETLGVQYANRSSKPHNSQTFGYYGVFVLKMKTTKNKVQIAQVEKMGD